MKEWSLQFYMLIICHKMVCVHTVHLKSWKISHFIIIILLGKPTEYKNSHDLVLLIQTCIWLQNRDLCGAVLQVVQVVQLQCACCLTCLLLLLRSLGYAVSINWPCLTTTSSIWHWSTLTTTVVLLSVFMRKTTVKRAISNSGLVPMKALPTGLTTPCQVNWRFRTWSSWSGCNKNTQSSHYFWQTVMLLLFIWWHLLSHDSQPCILCSPRAYFFLADKTGPSCENR